MKRNSKRFLALFLSMSMMVTPMASVYAEDSGEISQIEDQMDVPEELAPTEIPVEAAVAPEAETPVIPEQTKETPTAAEDEKKSEDDSNAEKEKTDRESEDTSEELKDPAAVTEKTETAAEAAPATDSGKVSSEEIKISPEDFKTEKLTVKLENEKLKVELSTRKDVFDKIYVGNKEDSTKEPVIEGKKNDIGGYTFQFELPVSKEGQKVKIVPRIRETKEWYADQDILIDIPKAERKEEPTAESKNEAAPLAKDDTTPDKESEYVSDLSGGTGRVDSSTSLKDGVYTPDSFSWSGGTGRVSISCNKVTVKNGQAYATIVFSSSSYSYVKANGNKYTGSHSGGKSVFVIPVQLNKNNKIIGMTTKMSAAHEIEYSIYIYIAGADGKGGLKPTDASNPPSENSMISSGNKKLDDEAPEIAGLEFKEETVLEHAKYFKIYHYEDDITLLEIDMTTDTAREDEEEKSSEDDKTEETAADVEENEEKTEAVTGEEGAAEETSEEEHTAEIYKGNVVKYLIIPEDAEIPAGLSKDVIIVEKPLESVFASSEEAIDSMDKLGLIEKISAVSCDAKDCPVEELAKAIEDESVVNAGTFDETEYKELLKQKCDFAVLPKEVLPQEDEDNDKDSKAKDKADTDQDAEETLTVEEQKERLEEITERYAILGIPVIVDRSEDEKSKEAKAEWIKVYGALFGCGEKAEKIYHKAVK